MRNRLLLAALAVALGASAALAAAPFTGKIAVVNKQHICILVSAKPEVWMKKGAKVRVLGGRATIVNVVADTLCVVSPKAAGAKVGEKVTLEKPRAGATGC